MGVRADGARRGDGLLVGVARQPGVRRRAALAALELQFESICFLSTVLRAIRGSGAQRERISCSELWQGGRASEHGSPAGQQFQKGEEVMVYVIVVSPGRVFWSREGSSLGDGLAVGGAAGACTAALADTAFMQQHALSCSTRLPEAWINAAAAPGVALVAWLPLA
jgi:hypothetical protein